MPSYSEVSPSVFNRAYSPKSVNRIAAWGPNSNQLSSVDAVAMHSQSKVTNVPLFWQGHCDGPATAESSAYAIGLAASVLKSIGPQIIPLVA